MQTLKESLVKMMSRPARGAWIEIPPEPACGPTARRRAPHGARGLKYLQGLRHIVPDGRAPHGARGLKSQPC